MLKQIIVVVILLTTVFFATYFITGLVVDRLMGDKVYGEDVNVSAEVESLKVKPNYGLQTDQGYVLQPAGTLE